MLNFNAIKCKEGRKWKRVIVNAGEMKIFASFVADMDLVDVSLFGGNFTWVKPDGSVTSGLDRFLISESLVEVWNLEK